MEYKETDVSDTDVKARAAAIRKGTIVRNIKKAVYSARCGLGAREWTADLCLAHRRKGAPLHGGGQHNHRSRRGNPLGVSAKEQREIDR